MNKTPSPALIIALVALAVATAGSSYAVISLPKNSVGGPQLKKDAVTSAKVRNRSLLAIDFRAGQLPQGPRGARGARGATGATGARGPSDGYVGNRSATPLLALDGSFKAVAVSPALPAGNYIVTGRANLLGGTGGASGIVCSLGDDAVQSLQLGVAQVIPLTMSSGVTLTSAGTVSISCLRGTGDASVAQASVAATRVENLTVQTTIP